ncbi:MAG: ATP synthase F1 subunit gamma [Lentisphaeraceae bacterium]|nr:ATP synthase F1 subunit gamma [Lentisphaeraceae bacterium]
MPSLKEYNVKIASLKNTAKVTKTMNMVSSAKFRKAQDAQNNSRLYATQLKGVIGRLAGAAGSDTHPLMQVREAKKALVVVFASDKGLCAGFNNNLIKFVKKWSANEGKAYDKVEFITTSKRATNGVKTVGNIIKKLEDIAGTPTFAIAKEIGELAQEKFVGGEYDEVFLIYNVFESALSQKPTLEKVLPMTAEKAEEGSGQEIDYIYEPSRTELLSYLLPKTVNFSFFSAFLESAAGEHAARMAAMDSATTNAKKLIDENTTLRNRARQAQITTELTEIVAGAESLK